MTDKVKASGFSPSLPTLQQLERDLSAAVDKKHNGVFVGSFTDGTVVLSPGAAAVALAAVRECASPASPPRELVERKKSVTLNLSDAEIAALEELCRRQELSREGIYRQALRLYQLRVMGEPDLGPKLYDPEAADAIASLSGERVTAPGNHKLDTDRQVFFYEQEFYVLSNFSAFTLMWDGWRFDTSEAAYHYEKFIGKAPEICDAIRTAVSAHEAFKIAERNKLRRRAEWDQVKVDTMRRILRQKAMQHEYVRRKLLETGDRDLIEDSWRDDFWGWGPNRDGQNMLGKLWMEVRHELRSALAPVQP